MNNTCIDESLIELGNVSHIMKYKTSAGCDGTAESSEYSGRANKVECEAQGIGMEHQANKYHHCTWGHES